MVSGRPAPLTPMEARMGAFTGMLEAFTRISAIFSDTKPWEEKAAETPLKDSVFGVRSKGGERTGCGPAPLSTVKMIPARVLPDEIRLVMLAFMATVKFATRPVLGWPLQTISISPIRSARPSARTIGGTALVAQTAVCADRTDADKARNKTVRTARDILRLS